MTRYAFFLRFFTALTIALLLSGPNGAEGATNKHVKAESCKVHAFYYLWYGTPEHDDGKYLHWNHEVLPHWDSVQNVRLKHVIGKRFGKYRKSFVSSYSQQIFLLTRQ